MIKFLLQRKYDLTRTSIYKYLAYIQEKTGKNVEIDDPTNILYSLVNTLDSTYLQLLERNVNYTKYHKYTLEAILNKINYCVITINHQVFVEDINKKNVTCIKKMETEIESEVKKYLNNIK